MSGRCSTLKVAGRDFVWRLLPSSRPRKAADPQSWRSRYESPDDSHIITFSGDNGRRPDANLYELPIDRMLLPKSKDRPKAHGLPVPSVELSAGLCKQVGNFVTLELSSITCSAVDKNGKKYELQYQSDGAPMAVRRIKRMRVGSPCGVAVRRCEVKAWGVEMKGRRRKTDGGQCRSTHGSRLRGQAHASLKFLPGSGGYPSKSSDCLYTGFTGAAPLAPARHWQDGGRDFKRDGPSRLLSSVPGTSI